MTYIDNESFLTPDDYGVNEEENTPVNHDNQEREDTNILRVPEHELTPEEQTKEWATEESKRAETIFNVYLKKRKELEEKGENSPILLIGKGSYIYETPFNHQKTRFHGHLEQDILVTRDKNDDKNLNLLYSFDSNNNQKFGGYYPRTFNFNGHFVLEKSIQNRGNPDHLGRPWAIDLNIIKDIDHLKAILK